MEHFHLLSEKVCGQVQEWKCIGAHHLMREGTNDYYTVLHTTDGLFEVVHDCLLYTCGKRHQVLDD